METTSIGLTMLWWVRASDGPSYSEEGNLNPTGLPRLILRAEYPSPKKVNLLNVGRVL